MFPSSRIWTSDLWISDYFVHQLQSTALPTELSKVHAQVAFFIGVEIGLSNVDQINELYPYFSFLISLGDYHTNIYIKFWFWWSN